MHVPRGARDVVRDPAASGDRALVLRTQARARARLRLPTRSRIEVVARSKPCHGIPRLRVVLDGKTAILRRAPTTRWTRLSSRRIVPAGRHAVSVSLADPLRARGCRRAVEIDAVRLVRAGAAVAPRPPAGPRRAQRPRRARRESGAPARTPRGSGSSPAPSTSRSTADMFDIDLFDNGRRRRVGAARERAPRRSATSAPAPTSDWRPDAGAFPADVLGNTVDGLAGRALARHPAPRRPRPDHGDAPRPLPREGLRRRRARQRRRLHQRHRLPAHRRRPARATTGSSPAPRTPAACRSGSRTTSTRLPRSQPRLRLGAQRGVLPVRRVRPPAAVRRRRQGRLQRRVRRSTRARSAPRRRRWGSCRCASRSRSTRPGRPAGSRPCGARACRGARHPAVAQATRI